MNKYFDIKETKQDTISAKLYYEKNEAIQTVILSVHGFGGHKDNAATERFAEKVLGKVKNAAVLCFDLPAHGNDVKKKLTFQDSLNYLKQVTEFTCREYQTSDIYVYTTSYGGFLVLNYLTRYGNPFRKIALRCPAINMRESLEQNMISEQDKKMLERNRTTPVGFDRKVMIDMDFLKDLENNDVRQQNFWDFADDLFVLHGSKDEIVDPKIVRDFCEENIIEYLEIENADHRFMNQTYMDLATKKVLEFFFSAIDRK